MTECPRKGRCFARTDTGKCSILSDVSYMDGEKCRFQKPDRDITDGKVYGHNTAGCADGISKDIVERPSAAWAEEWDAVTEPIRRKLQGA